MRIPNSCVRWLTEKATTPAMPAAVITSASSPNIPISATTTRRGVSVIERTSASVRKLDTGKSASCARVATRMARSISGAGNVSVFLNKGDGALAPPIDMPLDQPASSVVAGDLNDDGKIDLVVTHQLTSIYFGNGDGTFKAPIDYLPGQTVVVSGEFDAKPGLDLIVDGASFSTLGVAFLSNSGHGTFFAPRAYSAPISELTMVTRDLNGDGKCRDAFYKKDLVSVISNAAGDKGLNGLFRSAGPNTFEANKPIMVWSFGPDGLINDTQKANVGVNKDNILSW